MRRTEPGYAAMSVVRRTIAGPATPATGIRSLKATSGPIALGVWSETFRRDAARWIESDLALFQNPLRGGSPLAAERTIAVIQAWGKPEAAAIALSERVEPTAAGWVLALDAIDQSWEPRAVPLSKAP